MKISILQMNVRMGGVMENRATALKLLEEAALSGADVLVLPELWDIGFYPPDALALGDEEGVRAREFLSALAARLGVNIVGGSIARKSAGKLWNTAYVFDRGGALLAAYDKIHLFSPAGENGVFQPGEKPCLFTLDGANCGLITCYDLRFWELTQTLARAGAELLFVPAAWPAARSLHWRLLQQTRALEGQFLLAGANGCGGSPGSELAGHSMLVAPSGDVLAEAGTGQEVLSGEYDLARIRNLRDSFNVYRDRRPELYKL